MHNIEELRSGFPALKQSLFFASAGVGPLPQATLAAMQQAASGLRVDFAKEAWEKDSLQQARTLAATLIGAHEQNVILTDSTSTGINLLAGALPWKRGENIVLNDLEYPSNIFPWLYQADRHGLEVRMIRCKDGVVPLDDLLGAIDRRTRVLAVSHVEFGSGCRNDVAALAEAVHRVDGLICVDAIQSLGVFQVDAAQLGIDVLATGSYKWLCGPLGTGFAYVRPDLMEALDPVTLAYANLPTQEEQTVWNALVSGADYPMQHAPLASNWKRFEAQGLSRVLFQGLATSLGVLLDFGIDRIESRIAELVDYSIKRLTAAGIEILSPIAPEERSGILTVSVPFDLSRPDQVEALENRLEQARIKAHPRSGGLRLSLHFFNTTDEIDQVVKFLKTL